MTTFTVTIPDDRLPEVKEMAARFQIMPEELVRVSLEEFLSRPEDAFQRTVDFVLGKNTELYRRLVTL